MPKVVDNLSIEGAEILFKNFSGAQSQYNPAGNRNFCVIIPDISLAKKMAEDGWNVKWLQPRDEGDESRPYIQVNVSYKGRPPLIKTITSHGQTLLDEETVGMLDWADISNVDLIVNPYNWEVNGKRGVKGYVKAMYVSIAEDEFAAKYQEPTPFDENVPF